MTRSTHGLWHVVVEVTDPVTGRTDRALARRWLSRRAAKALARFLQTRPDERIVVDRRRKTIKVTTALDEHSWRSREPVRAPEPYRNPRRARVG